MLRWPELIMNPVIKFLLFLELFLMSFLIPAAAIFHVFTAESITLFRSITYLVVGGVFFVVGIRFYKNCMKMDGSEKSSQ